MIMKLMNLQDYTLIAEKIISSMKKKHLSFQMYNDHDELVCEIIEALVESDSEYREGNPENLSLEQCRMYKVINKTKTYFRQKTKYNKNLKKFRENPLPTTKEYNKEDKTFFINFLINNADLTSLQKEHINLFLQGYSTSEMAEHFKTSGPNCSQILNTSFEKMRALGGV